MATASDEIRKVLRDSTGKAIVAIELADAIGWSRHAAAYLNGSDRLWELAEAADNLAATIRRERIIATGPGDKESAKSPLVKRRWIVLREREAMCRRWHPPGAANNPFPQRNKPGWSEADRFKWRHWLAVMVADLREKGTAFGSTEIDTLVIASDACAAQLRAYASDARTLSEMLRMLLPTRRRGRGRTLKKAALFSRVARALQLEPVDLARRLVKELGVSADGTERPIARRAHSHQGRAAATWDNQQIARWTKRIRDADK